MSSTYQVKKSHSRSYLTSTSYYLTSIKLTKLKFKPGVEDLEAASTCSSKWLLEVVADVPAKANVEVGVGPVGLGPVGLADASRSGEGRRRILP